MAGNNSISNQLAPSASPLVKLVRAGVRREGRWLVRNIDLEIHKGEILTLVGPNGSGKSTTVKMALGILKTDEGEVTRQPQLKIGYIPQKLNIDWTMPMTVERFMRLTGPLDAGRMDDALEMAGAQALKFASLGNLSGGEFQRVMFARVIARSPDLLVLDEPVQGLDYSGEIEIYELIGRIRDKIKCGILLISHDLHLVMARTDRVICLNGHVCCEGTPVSVSESQEYKELFAGRIGPVHAFYEHHHDHTHLPDGRVMHADGSVSDNCHPHDGHHAHEKHQDKKQEARDAG